MPPESPSIMTKAAAAIASLFSLNRAQEPAKHRDCGGIPQREPAFDEINFDDISFEVPSDWAEFDRNINEIVILCENDDSRMPPYVQVEVRRDEENAQPEETIQRLLPNIRATRNGFNEICACSGITKSGISMARLDYEAQLDGIVIRQCDIVLHLTKRKRIFFSLVTEASHWSKWHPTFERMCASIRHSVA